MPSSVAQADEVSSIQQKWHRVLGRGTQCICVWPQNHTEYSVVKMYDLLSQADDDYLVRKIKRVTQQNSARRIRFDVFVANGDFPVAMHHITSLSGPHSWHVRKHVPYVERAARRMDGGSPGGDKASPRVDRPSLRVATLNVNGFQHKKHELSVAAIRGRWDVVLVQETLITADRADDVRLPGFTAVAGPALPGSGQRGTAVLVRKSLPVEPLVASANLTAARIFVGKQPVVVASVYVPNSTSCRKTWRPVFDRLGEFARDQRTRRPSAPMLIGGDFNLKPDQLDLEIVGWQTDLQRLAVAGSNLTWHTRLERGRATRAEPSRQPSTPPPPSQPLRRSERLCAQRGDGTPAVDADDAAALAAAADAIVDASLHPRVDWGRSQRSRSPVHWTPIDHLMVPRSQAGRFSAARVDRRVDLSDHFAVVTSLRVARPPRAALPRPRTEISIDARKLRSADLRSVYAHNRFTMLDEEWCSRQEAVDPVAGLVIVDPELSPVDPSQELTEAIKDVLADNGLLVQGPTAKHKIGIVSRRTRRMIEKRSRMFERLSFQENISHAEMVAYRELQRVSRQLVRQDKRRSWNKFVLKGLRLYRTNDPRGLWRWLMTAARRGRQGPSGLAPLRDKDGNLHVTVDGRMQVMMDHVTGLASASGSHSRDFGYWDTTLDHGNVKLPDGSHRVDCAQSAFSGAWAPVDSSETTPALDQLNGEVAYSEMVSVLRTMATQKAPGPSGVTVDLLRIILRSEDEDKNVVECPLGRLLLRLVRDNVSKAVVWRSQRTAHLVLLHKGKDPSDVHNYRGISLMDAVLKVSCTIVARRLSDALESCELLHKAQGGFRPREEAICQVVALYETCIRRREEAESGLTVIGFLDFKSAFDVVGHGAMLRKLELMGFRGPIMDFLRSVYDHSLIVLPTPGGMSGPVLLERGVRQGCPMSPALFDVFINDLVTNQSQGDWSDFPVFNMIPGAGRVSGLLFADDVALLAPCVDSFKTILAGAERWANVNEMTFGVAKCGVMATSARNNAQHSGAKRLLAGLAPKLGGQEVPIVSEYRYLGIPFNDKLDLMHIARSRSESVRKALFSLRVLLNNPTVPLRHRIWVFRCSILGVARYGGELLGADSSATDLIQKQLNTGLKWLAGMSGTSRRCCPEVLLLEFSLMDLTSMSVGAMIRAYRKWTTTRSVMADLINSSPALAGRGAGRTQSWTVKCRRWLDANLSDLDKMVKGSWNQTQPDVAGRHVAEWLFRSRVLRRAGKADGPVTLQRYLRNGYFKTRHFVTIAASWHGWSRGINLLVQARVGAYVTGPFMARAKIIPRRYANYCPFCEDDAPETLEHILLSCRSWAAQRELLADLIASCRTRGCSEAEMVVMLLGGACGFGHLPDWVGEKPGPDDYVGEDCMGEMQSDYDFDDIDSGENNDNFGRGPGQGGPGAGDNSNDDDNYNNNNTFGSGTRDTDFTDTGDDWDNGDGGDGRGNNNEMDEHVLDGHGGDEGCGDGLELQHQSVGPGRAEKFVPLFLIVARFLGSIQAERHKRFSCLSKRADARMGMAVHDVDGDGVVREDDDGSSNMVDFV